MTEPLPTTTPDLKDLQDRDLHDFVKKEVQAGPEGLTERLTKKIGDLSSAWADDTVGKLSDVDYDFSVTPYPLGDKYRILNKDGYDLIRDGFITIGGEASAGKTSFVTDLAIDILKHNTDTSFLFYTLDDGNNITFKRIYSQLNGDNLFKRTIDKTTERDPHKDITDRVWFFDTADIGKIERQARAVMHKHRTKKIIIAVDYLQAIGPGEDDRDKDRRILYNDNLLSLKRTQQSLQGRPDGGCILFCLSQVKRDKGGGGYPYRETSEIENQSDVCMDIELPTINQGGNTIPDITTPERIIRIRKNKMGMRGMTFTTEINKAFTFAKLEPETTGGGAGGQEPDIIPPENKSPHELWGSKKGAK